MAEYHAEEPQKRFLGPSSTPFRQIETKIAGKSTSGRDAAVPEDFERDYDGSLVFFGAS